MTMNNSPFRDLHLWKEEEKAEAWNLVESEAPMNADNILKVLKDFLEKEFEALKIASTIMETGQ